MQKIVEIFYIYFVFDIYKAGKLMIDRCKSPNLVIGGEVFAFKMKNLILNVKILTLQLGNIQIEDILTRVLQMVSRHHHVKLEGDFVNIIILILLLEGIGRQLDPTTDLLKS